MQICSDLVDQLLALDEAAACLKEYEGHYAGKCENLIQEKQNWMDKWNVKVSRMIMSKCDIICVHHHCQGIDNVVCLSVL